MSIDALVAPLLRVRLFQGLEPRQYSAISRITERVMYRDGTLISEAGKPGTAAILVVSGPAECIGTLPGEREPIAPGSLIGEMAMFVEHVYGTTVVARGPVKTLRLAREAMHGLMLQDQALAEHLVSRISARLMAVAAELRRVDETLAAPFADGSLARAFDSLPPPLSLPANGYPSLAAH